MSDKSPSLTRKAVNAGGWSLARRLAKSIPYAGTVVAVGMVGYDIKRKGPVYGVLNSGLDAVPFLGTAKNVVEFFTGDFFPDKKMDSQPKLPQKS